MNTNMFKSLVDLLEFIDIHEVKDEIFYADDGHHEVRSKHFSYLINKAREELKELACLPYPPTRLWAN